MSGEINQNQNLPQNQSPQKSVFSYSPVDGSSIDPTPIMGQGGFTDLVLGDHEVPKDLKYAHFEIFHKDNVLGFQSSDTKRDKMRNFDIISILDLFKTDYTDYDFNKELLNEKLRHLFETKVDRAVGTKAKDYINERKVLQSQFTEIKNVNEMNNNPGSDVRGNFFKKLMSRGN
jgi:hypothetical protein